jgi:hypothetical protein
MHEYTYPVADFQDGVNVVTLVVEARAALPVEVDLLSASVGDVEGVESCILRFAAVLSAEDKATLDAVVAAHTGEGGPVVPTVALVTPSGNPLPISQDGGVRFAPTFEDTSDLQPQWEGHLYKATAGATSIFDEVVDVEKKIRGGWYEVYSGAVLGDYIEFSVVDKDDVLGYFTPLGLVVGQDVLELQKYVRKEYVNPGSGGRNTFMANSVWPLIPGLYMRTTFVSTGDDDVDVKVVTLAYQ